jgi:deoxyinosine 3'endonuclease (endonuclease V)
MTKVYAQDMEDRREVWIKEREILSKKLITEISSADIGVWSENLKLVGGVDISFVKGDLTNACAAFVVCQMPSMEVVYQKLELVMLILSSTQYINSNWSFPVCYQIMLRILV